MFCSRKAILTRNRSFPIFWQTGIYLGDHHLPIDIDAVVTLRQGELRGKVHLSHRCFALEAWNAPRLRRRQPA
jgi:hypothetical protein